jgi:hypothetical protein
MANIERDPAPKPWLAEQIYQLQKLAIKPFISEVGNYRAITLPLLTAEANILQFERQLRFRTFVRFNGSL